MSKLLKIVLVASVLGVVAFADSAPFGVVRARVGNLKDNAYAVALQTDGKILTAGASFNGKDSDAVVVRYLPDGSVDRTFGEGGTFVFDGEKGEDKAFALLLRSDGKILVAGQVHNGRDTDFAVWRLTTRGRLDKKFGLNGMARIDFENGNDVAYALQLQSDGRIVVAGSAASVRDRDFGLVRLHENGVQDVSFGYNGKLLTALGDKNNQAGNETAYSLLIQSNGRIVAVGYSEVGATSLMAAVRYHRDGRLDRSFGDGGFVTPFFGNRMDKAYTAALDSSGGILLGGSTSDGNRTDFAIVRLNNTGRIDRYYGRQGIAIASVGGLNDTIYGLGLQPDGTVIAAGSSQAMTGMNLAVARFGELGLLDPNFGDGGRVILPGEGKYGAAYGLALQSDGKIVAAGVSSHGDGYQIALARYEGNGSLDGAFGLGPRGMQMARLPHQGSSAMTAEAGFAGWFTTPTREANDDE